VSETPSQVAVPNGAFDNGSAKRSFHRSSDSLMLELLMTFTDVVPAPAA
jgi:hypothetical protein